MASTTEGRSPSYEQDHDDFVRTLHRRRSDCQPYELAGQLLAYDHSGHTVLLGINPSADRVVLYRERDRTAIPVSIEPDGLADDGAITAGFELGPSVERWVETMGVHRGWLHPRWR